MPRPTTSPRIGRRMPPGTRPHARASRGRDRRRRAGAGARAAAALTGGLLLAAAAPLHAAAAAAAGELIAESRAHEQREEYEAALQLLDAALAAEPSSRDARIAKARCLARLKRPGEALAILDQLLEQDPGDPAALLDKGSNLARLGRHAEAAGLFRALVERDPAHGAAWYNLGCSQRQTNELEAALASFARAEAAFRNQPGQTPDETWCLLRTQQGAVHAARGDLTAALPLLEDAVRSCPWQESAYYQIAMVHARLGDRNRSRQWMDEFRRVKETGRAIQKTRARLAEPGADTARLRLAIGQLYWSIGDLEHARTVLLQAAAEAPADPNVWNTLGIVHARRREWDDAQRAFERASAGGANVEALVNLGSLALERGRPEEARTLYRRALALRPDYAPARAGLEKVEQASRPPAE